MKSEKSWTQKNHSPWHNVYIENQRLINHKFKYIKFINLHEFSSSFYFITRVLNALNSKLRKILNLMKILTK